MDCGAAELAYGGELVNMSEHSVLLDTVDGPEVYDIILFTRADTWEATDGDADCAARLNPSRDAEDGQWSVGDTMFFLNEAGVEVESNYHCGHNC